jgi:hypothetical protein
MGLHLFPKTVMGIVYYFDRHIIEITPRIGVALPNDELFQSLIRTGVIILDEPGRVEFIDMFSKV